MPRTVVPDIEKTVAETQAQQLGKVNPTVIPTEKDKPQDAPADKPLDAPVDQPKFSLEDLSDDQILELAQKRNLPINKVQLSEEEKTRQEQIEDVERLKFAVENKLITSEHYNELKTIINAEGSDLTKKQFSKAYQAENKNATKEEIEAAYKDYYWFDQKVITKDKKIEKDADGYEKEIEVDIEQPKYDERFVKWGENRRNKTADRIKEAAKQELDNIDGQFKQAKVIQSKINDYSKTVESVISELPSDKYTINVKVGKEEVPITFEIDDKAKEGAKDYLINRIGGFAIGGKELPTKDQVKQNADAFVRVQYQDKFNEKFAEYFTGKGRREGGVGANQPLVKETPLDINRPSELEAEAMKAIPTVLQNSNILNRNKNR